jgi:hypothetical protein
VAHPTVSGAALIPKGSGCAGQVGVAGGDAAAFAGRDLLVWVEAESGSIPPGADRAVVDLGPQSFTGIVDEGEVVRVRKPGEDGPVGRAPEDIDREESGRVVRNRLGGLLFIQVVGRGVDVDEAGPQILVQKNIGGRDETERGRYHLRLLRQVESTDDAVEGRRSTAHRHGVLGATGRRHVGLERLQVGAARQLIGGQHVLNVCPSPIREGRAGQGHSLCALGGRRVGGLHGGRRLGTSVLRP